MVTEGLKLAQISRKRRFSELVPFRRRRRHQQEAISRDALIELKASDTEQGRRLVVPPEEARAISAPPFRYEHPPYPKDPPERFP